MHLEESMEEKYDTLFKIKNNETKTLSLYYRFSKMGECLLLKLYINIFISIVSSIKFNILFDIFLTV